MKIMKNIFNTNINPKVFFSVIIIVSLISISLIVYAKTLTIGETGDILYIISKVGIGTTNPGYKLDVSGGDINVSNVYRQAGTAGINITCSGGQILENPVVSGGIVTGGTCAVGGGGTQGPPGPQGPRGLQGPEGERGPQGPYPPAPTGCVFDGKTYAVGDKCVYIQPGFSLGGGWILCYGPSEYYLMSLLECVRGGDWINLSQGCSGGSNEWTKFPECGK